MLVLVAALVAGAVVQAHEVTYRGTVETVEAARVQVQTLDESGAAAELTWFTVTADTEVRRGDTLVPYADAGIEEGERIVVMVNTDFAPTDALEIRLAPR